MRLASGAALGLLLGLLVGLSVSPVVSAVVTAITALIGGYVAQRSSADDQPSGGVPIDHPFVLSLSALCVVGIVAGLLLRTHGWLSPSIADEVARWKGAGYSASDAMRFAAERELGLSQPPALNGSGELTGKTPEAVADDKPVANAHDTALYAAFNAGQCGNLQPKNFPSTVEYANAFVQTGGVWKSVASAVTGLTEAGRRSILVALWTGLCR